MDYNAILVALGSAAYLFKSGAFDHWFGRELPNWIGRSAWALVVTAAIYNHVQPLLLPICFALAYLGVAVGYFNAEFNLMLTKNRVPKNYARLTARGMFLTFPLALFLWVFTGVNIWLSVLAGALFVPCYEAGITIYCYTSRWLYNRLGDMLFGGLVILCMN